MKHDDDMTFSPDELDTLNIWQQKEEFYDQGVSTTCLLYTSPSPRD